MVVSYNFQLVALTGETHALLHPDKLEGALARPRQYWEYTGDNDTITLGSYYMDAIAQAHAFEQGNKRTAFDSGFAFMMANGYELNPEADQELVAVAFVELIAHDRTLESFADLLKDYISPL